MYLNSVSDSLARFLASEEPQVIALSGKWGSGKTYFWTNFLSHFDETSVKKYSRYSYVSLFGVASLAELRDSIFENAISFDQISGGATAQTLFENAIGISPDDGIATSTSRISRVVNSLFSKTEEKARKYSGLLQSIPGLDKFGPFFRSAAFLNIRQYQICIDDIERRGAGLSIRDTLGLVSLLREQRKCSVIIILNSDALDESEQKEFDKFREKVFDYEIIFQPNAEDCANIVFTTEAGHYKRAGELCTKLGITNIRVLRRIKRVIDVFYPHVKSLQPILLEQLVQSAVLLTWCFNVKEDDVPSYEYVKKLNFGDFLELGSKKIPQEQRTWNDLISDYGYQETDEFDLEICRYLEDGVLDERSLSGIIEKKNQAAIESKLKNAFSAAWDIFNNSFDDDEDAFVKALSESFTAGPHLLSLGDVSISTKVLRELGNESLSEELVALWIDVHKKNNPAALNLDGYPFLNELQNPKLVEAVSAAYVSVEEMPSLEDVLHSLARDKGWSNRDERVLSSASADDYYKLFKKLHVDHLPTLVRAALKFQQFSNISEEQKSIVSKVKEALTRIAAENRLNELRVIRYGISKGKK